ncbi:jg1228 [Pararge aegeria aegeria]|uniref:Jg1228 protein n=1 Tax=Pararge aegeria aegeria TaxID=348720 RepID=A0A8S4QVU8_9NEOP|nr:jg1228 [Pararge aegeria aegeria]
MNIDKTQVRCPDNITHITVHSCQVKCVSEYVYLGKNNNFKQGGTKKRSHTHPTREVAFKKGYTPLFLKRKVFDQCAPPTMTYGAKTWTLKKGGAPTQSCSANNGKSDVRIVSIR